MRILFIIVAIVISLFSFEINIDKKNTNLQNMKLYYLIDYSNKLDINDIVNKEFDNFIYNKRYMKPNLNIWIKLNIKNITNNNKELYLHNKNLHTLDSVTYYEFENNKLINTIESTKNSPYLYGNIFSYKFNIEKNSSKTFYIKLNYPTYFFLDINLYDNKHSIKDIAYYPLVFMSMVSGMIILALYYFILYIFSSHKEYIYYFFFLIFASLSNFYIYNGVSYYLNIYGKYMFYFHTTIFISQIFMIFFIKSVFNIKKDYKYLNMLLNFNIFINAFITYYLLFIDYILVIEYAFLIHYYSIFCTIFIAIYLYIKKHPLSKFFLGANMIFFMINTISTLYYGEYLEYNFFTYYSVGFSVLFEAIAYSALLSYRINILQNENKQKSLKLIQKSKKEELGELFSIISHQLKQPISIISSQIMAYDILNFQSQKLDKDWYDNVFKTIKNQIKYSSDTIDKFRHFFNPNIKPTDTKLQDIIENSVDLITPLLKEKEINLITNISFNESIKNFPFEIMQVLLILLKNSIQAFEDNDNVKIIKVNCYQKDKFSYIEIYDNAGGIDKNIIKNIFDEYFSTKNSEDGTGLGLNLAKHMIEDICQSQIDVKAIDNTTTFTIRLNNLITNHIT